ncbi:MAG: nodulation protein NfeD [Chloroflexi bacterium]|nr:nodulation protein NfeD [Chloroflexota bacterium]
MRLSKIALRRLRIGGAILAITLGALIFACGGGLGAAPGSVHVLTTNGTVGPVMDRYLGRGIDTAEDEDAAAVVIRLNTPGGLLSSTDDIDSRILNAEVPIVVYVWPTGAQAASAGTFITMASHVAAMAPSTVIGSATPVGGGGEDIEGDLGNKVTENAVAKIRAMADLRGRNADWAESAVRDGISAEQNEALELNVIDYIASDLDDLLAQIDGEEVELSSGAQVTLNTADAPVAFNNTNFIEDFLAIIADPNIAFLLLSLGSLAIFIEIINFGAIFPGVFGVIALLLGFFALSVLPFSWAGVALILFAFMLFGLELFVTSGGVLGIGGVFALVLGGLLLMSDNPPEFGADFEVSRWLVFSLAAVLGAMVLFVLANIIRIRKAPVAVGVETMIGKQAVVRTALDPSGYVFLEGEAWAADIEGGQDVESGEHVIITEVHGLRLKVKKEESEGEEEDGTAPTAG